MSWIQSSDFDFFSDSVPSDSSSEHILQGSTGRDNARRCSERYQTPGWYPLPVGPAERLQRAENRIWQIQIAGPPYGPLAHVASPDIIIGEDEDSESGA